MQKKYAIYLHGCNAVGKSSISGWLKQEYGDQILTLGNYKIKEGRKYHTGGADGLSYTNNQRRQQLMKNAYTDRKIVLSEGMIISSHNFIKFHREIKQKTGRTPIIIRLYADIDKIVQRTTWRSGGKSMNDVRYNRFVDRLKSSKRMQERSKEENPDFIHLEFDTTNQKIFSIIKSTLKQILG